VLPAERQSYFPNPVDKDIGIDFGVGSKLTLSNGIRIDFEVHETPRFEATSEEAGRNTKRLQKQRKIQFLLRKEYEKLNNRRKDAQTRSWRF